MLFLNSRQQLLLFLRDNKPEIPYPNTWDPPGGQMEGSESPKDCIQREMGEELPGLDLGNFRPYKTVELGQQIHYIFWTRIDASEDALNRILCEGQRVAWMT
jgi:8-oxo-dGTP diphosphatase